MPSSSARTAWVFPCALSQAASFMDATVSEFFYAASDFIVDGDIAFSDYALAAARRSLVTPRRSDPVTPR